MSAMVADRPTLRDLARILGGNEPTPIPVPVDPESLDATRPVDLDDCPTCQGVGCIVVEHDDTVWRDACWACGGSGQRGAW